MKGSKKRRREAKKREADKKIPKRYYDACVLEEELIYHEITSKSKIKPIISHLALGEAYGNCLKNGEQQADDFLRFIGLLKKHGYLNIVGNDKIDKIFTHIRDSQDFRFSITDAIHLATAIRERCSVFTTKDKGDFEEIHKDKIKNLGRKYGILNLCVLIVER